MKKIFRIFLLAVLLVTLIPVKSEAAKTKYIIKADVIYKIYTNEKITLYVDTESKISWSSANKKIATVSSKGVVTGKKPGDTTITAKVGKKKYKCKIEVWSREVIVHEHDINPVEPTDRYAAADYNFPTEDTKSTVRNIDGIDDDWGGKMPQTEVPEWIGESYLKDAYDLAIFWAGDKIYLVEGFGDSYTITGSPESKFESDKIYEGNYNSYTIRFKYDKEILFNTEDLKAAGLIDNTYIPEE